MTFVFDGIAATREREGTRGDVLALGGVADMSKLVGQLIEVGPAQEYRKEAQLRIQHQAQDGSRSYLKQKRF